MQAKLSGQANFFITPLRELLNPDQPLYKLADEIAWRVSYKEFRALYSGDGGPSHPVRLMVNILIIKHLRILFKNYMYALPS